MDVFLHGMKPKIYGGKNEKLLEKPEEPEKPHNYHILINDKATAKMSTVPWCASFVNYCFQKVAYPK